MSVKLVASGRRAGKPWRRRGAVPSLFAVVSLDPADLRQVREVVVVFSSEESAFDYAMANGLTAFAVSPLRLVVGDPNVSMLVGREVHHDPTSVGQRP